jgi:uncharacterized membrane protein
MKNLGVKKEVAEKLYRNELIKKKNKEKEDYKNMTAS